MKSLCGYCCLGFLLLSALTARARVETSESTEDYCYTSDGQRVPCPSADNPTPETPIHTDLELYDPAPLNYDADYDMGRWTLYSQSLAYNTFDKRNGTHWFSPDVLSAPNNYWLSFESSHQRDDIERIMNVCRDGASNTNENIVASAYLIKGQGDNDFYNNLVLVSDGFDPGNNRTVLELIGYRQFNKMFETESGTPLGEGYDVVFVDYHEGAGDIQVNAKAFLRVLQYLCSKAEGKRVIVGGFSMGGIIARLAMLYGQMHYPETIDNVYKLISIDSPQQGAAIPLEMQKIVSLYVEHPPDFADKFVGQTQMVRSLNDINRPAARQMLYEHHYSWTATREHDRFYDFLTNTMGDYPEDVELYSIADANWEMPYPNDDPGVVAVDINGRRVRLYERELAPGSYIDVFNGPNFSVRWGTDPSEPTSGILGFEAREPSPPSTDSRFKPTFMPLYSVFDLRGMDFYEFPSVTNQEELDEVARRYSAFDKLYIANYGKRYAHIIFNDDLINVLMKAIADPVPGDISPIINLLLLD